MELTEKTKIFDGVDGNEWPMEYLIEHIDPPVRKYILGLSNVNIQLNKDIKEIAAQLLVFEPQLSSSFVKNLKEIVKR